MKQSRPPEFEEVERGAATSNTEKWDVYRASFLKLIAEEARLQMVADMPPAGAAEDGAEALRNAVVGVEFARLVYDDSRNVLATALLRKGGQGPLPGPEARSRWVERVADLLSDFRDDGAGATAADQCAAERIVSAAHARFLEQTI